MLALLGTDSVACFHCVISDEKRDEQMTEMSNCTKYSVISTVDNKKSRSKSISQASNAHSHVGSLSVLSSYDR